VSENKIHLKWGFSWGVNSKNRAFSGREINFGTGLGEFLINTDR